MTTYTKIAVKGAATILFISLIAAFLGYLIRIILARNLSVEEFGLFYAVFAFLGLIGVFKSLGFDKALAKFIPEFMHKKENDSIKNSILYVAIIQIITNSIMILAIYLLSNYLAINFFHNAQATIIIKLLAIAFFIDSFSEVLKFAFQGFKKMTYFSGMDLIRMLLITTTILIGFKLNYGLLSPIIAYIITPVVLLIIFSWVLVKRVFPEFFASKFMINKMLLKRISKYSIHILAISVGGVILGYTDIIMLTYFSGLTSVALYSVALPTTRILLYFPRALAEVLLPLTSELWVKKKKKILVEGIESLYKYSFIIIMPLAFMMFSFSDLIINVFFGRSYIQAATAMKILSIGMVLRGINSIGSNFFPGIGKPQITSKIVYSGAIFNFIANLILIPILGIIGAAITTSLSYLIMMIISLANMRKFIAVKFPIKIWAKSLIAGLIFTFMIWLLKGLLMFNVWLETAIVLLISGIAYIVLLFLLKVINTAELKDLYRRIIK
jgi:O-antigen/teichoic acid export membrane protein